MDLLVFLRYGRLSMNNLAEVCKLKYSIKKLGEKIQALCMVFTLGEI
jgi:hypothetical protein